MLFEIIRSLVSGLIIGAIARLLMPGRDSMGLLSTALLGIAGSFVGTIIAVYLLHRQQVGWILSIIGAVILLALFRWLRGRQT